MLAFPNLHFTNLPSAEHTARQLGLKRPRLFPPSGVREGCCFITSSSELWACSFCTISSASRMRRFSCGECSAGVSSLSYDSRMARIPSRSCREEQKSSSGVKALKPAHAGGSLGQLVFLHCKNKKQNPDGYTLMVFVCAWSHRCEHAARIQINEKTQEMNNQIVWGIKKHTSLAGQQYAFTLASK